MKENKLSQTLNTIPIPDELDHIVNEAILKGQKEALSSKDSNVLPLYTPKKNTAPKWFTRSAACAAVVMISFVGAANISPTFAKSLENIPVLNSLVKVVSFRQFDYEEDTYRASIDTPVIDGLSNTNLEQTLNQKYLAENKALFESFEKEVADMKAFSEEAHLGVDSGFEVKTNNDQILSIGRYVINTVGSSSTTMTYDTIDKKNELLITLPSLFKDDSYIKIISENIKDQMRTRAAADSSLSYWIAGDPDELPGFEGFDTIAPEQSFYISDSGKLVISFDKYAVGPGSIGIQEFTIPSEILEGALVSNVYIH